MPMASQRTRPLGLFPGKPTPRLYDHLIGVLRVRHYSRRTEEAYVHWIRRYIEFHGHQHPRELAESDVNRFLTHLAVAASTQNQALSAILFLYEHEQPLERIEGVVRARRPKRLPVVLTVDEVSRVVAHLSGDKWLIAMLMYGAGLRLLEALRLRVKDLDFQRGEITVRQGKGDKDRVTMLPQGVIPAFAESRPFTNETWPMATGAWSSRTRWPVSIPTPTGNGVGSLSFRRNAGGETWRPAIKGAITSTSPLSRGRSSKRYARRA
jgi:hypothetical protein